MLYQTNQLLTTKLFIPALPSQYVLRERLTKLMQQGLERKLLLVCAPAGFGKTTLIAQWHQTNPQPPLAWISLDKADNEPLRFLRYLVAAFSKLIPATTEVLLSQLEGTQPAPIETVLTTLLNSLTNFITDHNLPWLGLVLDDYHVIQNQLVHNIITFLLDYLPPELHLIITSRIDPAFSLARLRSQNQLVEIRASDLRFQLDEIIAVINREESLTTALAPEDIKLLALRTEGWAVGLQLALMWLKDRENKAAALKTFAGSNRFILEYLADEVLSHQPESRRLFLLKTALLERFNASLASAVTSMEWDSEDLSQLNLFMVSLDDQNEWYRYHHLFAEFLQYRLKHEFPSQIGELHLRASRWLEEKGLLEEAIEHAVAAPDFDKAATLIEKVSWSRILRGEYLTLKEWIAKIPATVMYAHPILCLYSCYIYLLNGRISGYEDLLEAAETGLRISQPPNEDKLLQLLILQTFLARSQNDFPATQNYARQAAVFIKPGDAISGLMLKIAQAQICVNNGELVKAQTFLNALQFLPEYKENILIGAIALVTLADIYVLQANLGLALTTYQEVLKLDPQSPRLSILIFLRIANIYLEWNETELAAKYTNQAEETKQHYGSFDGSLGYLIYGNLWWPDGDHLPTVNWINATNQQMDQYWQANFLSQITNLRNRYTRNLPLRVEELEEWSKITFPMPVVELLDKLDYQREPQYLALARVLIYQSRFEEAVVLLQNLKNLAQKQTRQHSLIKIQLVLALAYQALTSKQPAPQEKVYVKLATFTCKEALTLAESGGYLRVFTEEGEKLKQLLLLTKPSVANNVSLKEYLSKVLAAFNPDHTARLPHPEKTLLPHNSPVVTNKTNLIEALSEREMEVLRLVARGASNQEIAQELTVTLSTVKKHIVNIFGKLEVANRTQAVLRAQELTLL